MLDILGKKKHRRAPRIKVHRHHNAGDRFIATSQATLDTGAEATVAGLDILKQIGLDTGNTRRPPDDKITAANGTSFECVGTVDVHIHAADKSTKETVLSCKEQKGLLLAWYVSRDFGFVPNDYPKPVRAIPRSSLTKSPGNDATELESSGRRTRMRNDIATTVASCNKCQEHRPSHQRQLPRVFEDISADFFHYAGRDFLVYVD